MIFDEARMATSFAPKCLFQGDLGLGPGIFVGLFFGESAGALKVFSNAFVRRRLGQTPG